ncbi:MAG: histidinol phosphate phosphatase [Clostridium sp.]|uniref:histidinol phosphate phosphatase n=1 Tax=Clostridium sp. TaxID=1506 RepID=UPI0025C248AA|nr:histidinol phosphate phosphatase [Clostridium sp.]MCH3964097.1 histidinol phosphate phosphatase [Clostridium sp.]MCI1716298.1 histidinol phosphate phosphatase [Clostridium sp.]MCI1800462.1 histidinol phosphate phosphatase [Clostridium sp.]MCI1814475.1 histidinol phosphate phosphatase [Clostridium sp.]MCI1871374.1 histidinol phosphate phosphatase [Clostridium sp.]
MFDTHVHTRFSTDSDMKIEEALKSARDNRLGLILTEHMDIGYPDGNEFLFNIEDYFKAYSGLRGETMLLGIEIGMKEDCVKKAGLIARDNPFDYVIGAIHLVDNLDLYYDDFYIGKSKKDAYRRYLESMLLNLKKFDFIDSLAHIDYICRYSGYEDPELHYGEFPDILDEILKLIIQRGKCIELNTRRLNSKSAVENFYPIYRRYRELGGKYITLGSDAHTAESIGNNFREAAQIAEDCNLRIVYFKDRKMEY